MKHLKAIITVIVFLFYADIQSQPHSLALIPFTIDAKENLSFLNDSIYSVYSSTLSKKDSLIIIDRDSIETASEKFKNSPENDRALQVGSALNANYVLYGTIFVSDTIIQIKLKVMDLYLEEVIIDFSASAKQVNDIMPIITQCFIDSYAKIWGENTKIEAKADSITPQPQPVTEKTPPAEKKKKKPKKTDTPAKKASGTNGLSMEFWKSPTLNICINGLAITDINNDEKNELIVLTTKSIQQYNYADKKLTKIVDIYKPRFLLPIGIDVADVNRNGSKEIYITALNTYRTNVLSFAIENTGQNFTLIARNLNWYLRVVSPQDDEEVLLGQKHNKNYPFRGEVSNLAWDKAKIVPGKQLIPSMNVNVLGLGYGKISKEDDYIVAYDKGSRINVINRNDGEIVWESREDYGGSTFYYKLEGSYAEEQEYLPMRILVSDINGDGIGEVIAVKNYEITRSILGKFRYYNKNHIEIFSWDGISLNTIWKTGIIFGFVRDFAVGDLDNDGKDELVAAIVKKEGKSIFFKPESYLIVYELN